MELVINFSGGKDSIVMLHYLATKYPDVKKHVVFANTGWEHTDAEQWCRDIVEVRFGLPLHVVQNPNDFFAMVRRRLPENLCTSPAGIPPGYDGAATSAGNRADR